MDKEKIIVLKGFLEQEEKIDERIRVRRAEFEEAHKELFLKQEQIRESIRTSKAILSDDAIAEFQNSGEKKLLGGIGIRVGVELNYNPYSGFQWALDHKLCLALDKKEFEKIAKTQDIDFVKKLEKVTVTFPKQIKFEVD